MSVRPLFRAVIALPLLVSSAHAATIAGTVTGPGAAPLEGMEVRAWKREPKGWEVAGTAFTSATGAYTLDALPAGAFKVYVRNGPGGTHAMAERWYAAAGTASGYVGEDATLLDLAADGMATAIDVVLEPGGGMDGVVTVAAAPTGGLHVRAEWMGDHRVHHNDVTKSIPERMGEYGMRALPPGDFRIMAYDLNAQFDTVFSGMQTVAAGAVSAGPATSMVTMPADPREPNNALQDAQVMLDIAAIRQEPPMPVVVEGSLVGPRNSGDVDLYCLESQPDDRLIVDVRGEVVPPGGTAREHPYVDVVAGFFADPASFAAGFMPPVDNALVRADGLVRVAENDDTGPGTRAARVDTGVLDQVGRWCIAVTTYGDTTYTGMNQASAGRYALRVRMGNRPPVIAASVDVAGQPAPGKVITMDEGQRLLGAATFTDPEADVLTASWFLEDAMGARVAGAELDATMPVAAFEWRANFVSARRGPYRLVIRAADAEFTREHVLTVVVNAVNVPPTTPVPLSPADEAWVDTATPVLWCSASTDENEDPLQYEFELHRDTLTDGGVPVHFQAVAADGGVDADGGLLPVGWQTPPLEENAHYAWRVRAFDGQPVSGRSTWSAAWKFFVNARNDPPAVPEVVKPLMGEEVMVRRPVVSSSLVMDPEGDDVRVEFQVAEDVDFTVGVLGGEAVPQDNAGESTMWTVPADLAWGGAYHARVRALDEQDAASAWSQPVSFRVKANSPPVVSLGAPFSSTCNALVLEAAPASITVDVQDPELEPLAVTLQVFFQVDNPDTAVPVYNQQRTGAGATTLFDVAGVGWLNNFGYRVRARASDGTDTTGWTECTFTVTPPVVAMSSSSQATTGTSASASSGPSSAAGSTGMSGASAGASSGGANASASGGASAFARSTGGTSDDGAGEGASSSSCGCDVGGDARAVPGAAAAVMLALVRLRRRQAAR